MIKEQKGKAVASKTTAKPLQNERLLTGKCYQMHPAESRKILEKKLESEKEGSQLLEPRPRRQKMPNSSKIYITTNQAPKSSAISGSEK